MTTLNYTVTFHKTVLASFIGLCISSSCFALEAMSDEKLGETTGEGIALLPQDTYMVFRGVGANENAAQLLDRTKDTGYINYIPVGPLSPTAADTNKSGVIDANDQAVGKADLFLYGLAISKTNDADPNDINERVGMLKTSGTPTAINAIKSWGTATNPWLVKVDTEYDVPTFDADTSGNEQKGNVTYLALEAPAFETGPFDVEGADAYKLKLGMWADAFVRNPNKVDGDPNQFQYGNATGLRGTGNETLDRANRLRLQAIWNNFSLNGSKIQIFQTLDGATSAGGMSPFYNKTLGIAGVVRLNSGKADDLKLNTRESVTESTGTMSAWNTIHAGADSSLSTSSTGNCNNSGANTIAIGMGTGCQYIVQKRSRTDSKTLTRSWDLPAEYKNRVLRLSTQETTDTNTLYTPALDTSGNATAPTFAKDEGIFIYNLNANLVLGSLYQPLILGSDGTNFSLEIARIPNKESIYKKVYTNYDNQDPSTNGGYYGSTCNIYQCGSNGVTGYQGNNATHSSISIGSVYSADGGKTLQAYKGADAVGVSFGAFTQTNTATTTKTNNELQYLRRTISDKTWTQRVSCNLVWSCTTTTGHLYEWAYNGSVLNSTSAPTNAPSCTYNCNNVSGTTPMYGSTANRAWSDTNLRGLTWQTAANSNVDSLVQSTGFVTGVAILPTNMAPMPSISSTTPLNNLGSAVIDGMLIQHMKITTKGL